MHVDNVEVHFPLIASMHCSQSRIGSKLLLRRFWQISETQKFSVMSIIYKLIRYKVHKFGNQSHHWISTIYDALSSKTFFANFGIMKCM